MKIKCTTLFLSFAVMTLPVYAEASKGTAPTEIQNSSVSKQIDLNKADLSALTGSFKGIGRTRAKAIIDYRESHKGFKSIEELAQVKGIGHHFVEINKDKLKQVYLIK